MIKDQNPYLVEFNVRMGDPECQTILPLLNDDLVEIFINCCLGKLTKEKIILSEKKVFALCSVQKDIQIILREMLVLKD